MAVDDPWQHLLSQIMAYQNAVVNSSMPAYSGTNSDGNPSPNMTVPADSLRLACEILPDDTALFVILRLLLFNFILMQNLPQPIFGLPCSTFQESSKVGAHPKILLFFQQKIGEKEAGYPLLDMQISFPLIKYTNQTITMEILTNYAKAIRASFIASWSGGSFYFEKGPNRFYYKDPAHGYNLRCDGETEQKAIAFFTMILNLQGDAFDINLLSKSQSGKMDAYGDGTTGLETPTEEPQGTITILGKTKKLPRWRPAGKVYFDHAEIYIPGVTKNLLLCGILLKPKIGAWLG